MLSADLIVIGLSLGKWSGGAKPGPRKVCDGDFFCRQTFDSRLADRPASWWIVVRCLEAGKLSSR
jgi:hypothetical protein